jgi:hypothetical protein
MFLAILSRCACAVTSAADCTRRTIAKLFRRASEGAIRNWMESRVPAVCSQAQKAANRLDLPDWGRS